VIGSLLGQTEQDAATEATAKSTLRTELLKKIALGGGWSVGASVVWGVFELLKDKPDQAFPLLRAWGPWAIVTIVALYFGYDILKVLLAIGTRGVVAIESLAAAQEKLAEKDDRQLQELQTLTSYTSQSTERLSILMHSMHDKLDLVLGAKGETK
jgi:hypothetical protein